MGSTIRQKNNCNHTWASKKSHLGGKFPGINPKNLPAAFGGQKFFSPAPSPLGRKWPKSFYPWDTYGLLPGKFCQYFVAGFDAPGIIFGIFLEFFWIFLIFSDFSWFFSIFSPKICRPPSAATKFFRPWVVDPYPEFFTHGSKSSQGCSPHPLSLPMGVDQNKFFTQGCTPHLPPLCPPMICRCTLDHKCGIQNVPSAHFWRPLLVGFYCDSFMITLWLF